MESVIYLTLLLLLLPLLLFLNNRSSKKLPPGSMGLPIVGQSLSLLRALRANWGEEWLQERIRKYGPISKLSLFGTPTVFLHGQAANKFIYTCDGNTFATHQPTSIRRLIGDKNLMELDGDDHRRVRGALVSFLKPEVLKQYVGRMDEEVGQHLEMHWHGKQEVTVMPLMKTLTFNIICTLIFGIERGARRDTLIGLFQDMMEGILSVPINLPFTRFNHSLRARAKIKTIVMDLISEKRVQLEKHGASPHQDLVSCLLSIRNKDGSAALSDEEILDNAVIVMLAGHETSSILLTFLVRLFANNPSVYSSVLQEQEEIAKSKGSGELLRWEDLMKMKYTWRVAMETLRVTPPIFLSFRRTLKDVEYGDYIIPKGWQVVWSASMTHMDETIFPEPEKFDPMRSEKQGTPPPYSFVAFGGGARNCPGYEFARMETLAMVHHLVTKFTWKLSCKDDSFSRDPLPVFNKGLPIHIEEKKSKSM
ncbi:taxane 10-beta-hydroxylase-like [Cornus florida]|uniref:taxane 10-beta-hydroxylase-like n=1 Tax=Cornus florida TaxID=4283 RepID=UPI002899503F|nr:taxane 10-beta-hydroxylase-like [Cornus florida]